MGAGAQARAKSMLSFHVHVREAARYYPKDDEDNESELDEQVGEDDDSHADEESDYLAKLAEDAKAVKTRNIRDLYPTGHPATWPDGVAPSALPMTSLPSAEMKKLGPQVGEEQWRRICTGSWQSVSNDSWSRYAKAWDINPRETFDELIRVGYHDRAIKRDAWLDEVRRKYGELYLPHLEKQRGASSLGAGASFAAARAAGDYARGSKGQTSPSSPKAAKAAVPSGPPELHVDGKLERLGDAGLAGGFAVTQKRMHGFPAGGMHTHGW